MGTGEILLAASQAIGRLAHAQQVRKGSGEPYYQHLDRVAGRVIGWRAKTVAYLHDLIEDTPVTGLTLEQLGFPPDIITDVVALSRAPGETYAAFIDRTIRDGSDDALQVKLADLADNLHDRSWPNRPRERYIRADAKVRSALIERGAAPIVAAA
jgi:(p)ppGpp synthase/HD superfamily hydrolase